MRFQELEVPSNLIILTIFSDKFGPNVSSHDGGVIRSPLVRIFVQKKKIFCKKL